MHARGLRAETLRLIWFAGGAQSLKTPNEQLYLQHGSERKQNENKKGKKETNQLKNYYKDEFGIIQSAMICKLTYQKSLFRAF